MNAAKEKILSELRVLLPKKETLDCPSFEGAIPKGAITTISGHGKTTWTAQFLSQHKNAKIAWVEEKLSIFPLGIMQNQISLDRILFVEAKDQCEWTILQLLKSQVFQIVVAYADSFLIRTLRRIQLASEKADAAFLWLAPSPQKLWPISLEMKILPHKKQSPVIVRQRLS